MKKIIFISILALVLSACSTMQMVTVKDLTDEGIKFKYGSSRGMKIGDKVIAYNKRPSTIKRGYSYDKLGTLTVAKVEEDQSILKKDANFEVNENTALLRE